MKQILLLALIGIPIFCHSQLSDSLEKMKADSVPDFANYEQSLLDATEYIFSNPVNFKSKEFASACRIVDFWKNEDTGINVPVFGNFYNSLDPKSNQRYFYMIAITNYILMEKFNNNRLLENVKIEGQKYSEQEDVKESQIGGAKIFLDYISDENNRLPLNFKSKKFLKAHKKGELNEMFFE